MRKVRKAYVGCVIASFFNIFMLAMFQELSIFSETSLKSKDIWHDAFHNEEHFYEQWAKDEMTQGERLEVLGQAVTVTSQVLDTLGLQAFLESATLIGWLRHNRTHMPWDTDTDVGMLRQQCEQLQLTKEAVQEMLPEPYLAIKFGCVCQEDCEGDSERIAGRIVDNTNGFFVDIFSYEEIPTEDAEEWMGDRIFYRRIADRHAHYVFPREVLLPLREDWFEEKPVYIPNQVEPFLHWEYGQCLGKKKVLVCMCVAPAYSSRGSVIQLVALARHT